MLTSQSFNPGINACNFNKTAVWRDTEYYDASVTTIGSNGGPSFYGTYDQSGQLYEWNDLKGEIGTFKGIRGGSFLTTNNNTLEESIKYLSRLGHRKIPASYGYFEDSIYSKLDLMVVGFRIASKNNPLEFDNFLLIEDIDNTPDSTGFGKVSYSYYINKYMVTNDEYVDFLNNKAQFDIYNLYNPLMSGSNGGINRTGSSGNYIYSSKINMGNKPVNYIDWFNCARYCNWLCNGKENGDTENGAYLLQPIRQPHEANFNPNPLFVTNTKIDAAYRLPTENEWYKAAFYTTNKNGGGPGYWNYATQSDDIPLSVCGSPNGDGNLTCDPTPTPTPTQTPSPTPSPPTPTSSPTASPTPTPTIPDFVISGNESTILGDSIGVSPYPPPGWTSLWDGTADAKTFQINLPFNWTINNTSYNSLYLTSNCIITFGGSSTVGSNLSASNPPYNKIFFGAADNSVQRICTLTNGNEYIKIRFEGRAATAGSPGSPNIITEITFYNPANRNNLNVVEFDFGLHSRTNGLFGIANTNAYYVNSYLSEYSSYVFVGNTTGTYFQLYGFYHVEDRLNQSFLTIDSLNYDNSAKLIDSVLNIDVLCSENL